MPIWISNILIFTMGSFIFSQHFHFFGSKIQHFSTFGLIQDDHDHVVVILIVDTFIMDIFIANTFTVNTFKVDTFMMD